MDFLSPRKLVWMKLCSLNKELKLVCLSQSFWGWQEAGWHPSGLSKRGAFWDTGLSKTGVGRSARGETSSAGHQSLDIVTARKQRQAIESQGRRTACTTTWRSQAGEVPEIRSRWEMGQSEMRHGWFIDGSGANCTESDPSWKTSYRLWTSKEETGNILKGYWYPDNLLQKARRL